jgi:hypothetical protein
MYDAARQDHFFGSSLAGLILVARCFWRKIIGGGCMLLAMIFRRLWTVIEEHFAFAAS